MAIWRSLTFTFRITLSSLSDALFCFPSKHGCLHLILILHYEVSQRRFDAHWRLEFHCPFWVDIDVYICLWIMISILQFGISLRLFEADWHFDFFLLFNFVALFMLLFSFVSFDVYIWLRVSSWNGWVDFSSLFPSVHLKMNSTIFPRIIRKKNRFVFSIQKLVYG